MNAYTPKPVSNWFRFDWNYTLRIIKVQYFRWVAQLAISTPLLAPFLPVFDLQRPQVQLIWGGGASFLVGYLILNWRAPPLLREYSSYKEFGDHGHAHRWIVWLLQEALPFFDDQARIMNETIDKGLSVATRTLELPPEAYAVAPLFPAPSSLDLTIFRPINLNNDIYLPFHLGGKRYVLPMQAADSHVEDREKELFWIIYSGCASSRKFSRKIVWFWFIASAALVMSAGAIVLWNMVAPLLDPLFQE
jgi:hypothetical protein